MSKTLETKKKILDLLKKKQMTISGLSDELNLSTATISQHLDELQRMGAVEKVNNEYFKKLKYYKAKETVNPVIAKYITMIIVLLVAVSAVYLYRGSIFGTSPNTGIPALANNSNNNTITTTAPAISTGGGSFACPMEFYELNGSIVNYSGFTLYHLNYSNSTIADYVISNNSSGKFYATELVSHVLPEPANSTITSREHYVSIVRANGRGFATPAEGINVSISPENFTVANNTKLNLTVAIATNSTTPNETYFLRIDGPCDGGVTPVLLTVGKGPYNGTINQSADVIA
jgi:DNA-binding transcriptional ArsR family regulator